MFPQAPKNLVLPVGAPSRRSRRGPAVTLLLIATMLALATAAHGSQPMDAFRKSIDDGLRIVLEEQAGTNYSSAADSLIPVHKFRRSAGDRSLPGVPFGPVIAISFGSGQQQYLLERDAAEAIGLVSNLLERHGS